MGRTEELLEAKLASKNVLESIDLALEKLNSAKGWGIFDIFGGGFLTSIIKRDKLKEVNSILYKIDGDLDILSKELRDINYEMPFGFSDSFLDDAFDVFFDNIFTDIRVQTEISDTIKKLKVLWGQVKEVDEYLEGQLEGYLD